MHVFIAEDHATMSRKAAEVIRDEIAKNIDRKGRFILGLATGSTQAGACQRLGATRKSENPDGATPPPSTVWKPLYC